jgi:hypothetical protein
MRRIERIATTTATFAVRRVSALVIRLADYSSPRTISRTILPASPVVAILGVLLVLRGPAVLLASDVAGLPKKLDTNATVGG